MKSIKQKIARVKVVEILKEKGCIHPESKKCLGYRCMNCIGGK